MVSCQNYKNYPISTSCSILTRLWFRTKSVFERKCRKVEKLCAEWDSPVSSWLAEGKGSNPSTELSHLMLYLCVSCRDKRCNSHFCLISVSEGLYATCMLLYSFWRFDSHPTPSLWEAGGKCTCLKVSSQLKLGKQAESSSGLFHNQLSMTSVETQEISLPSPCSYTYLSCQSFV